MKKIVSCIISSIMLICLAVGLTACGGGKVGIDVCGKTHTFSNTLSVELIVNGEVYDNEQEVKGWFTENQNNIDFAEWATFYPELAGKTDVDEIYSTLMAQMPNTVVGAKVEVLSYDENNQIETDNGYGGTKRTVVVPVNLKDSQGGSFVGISGNYYMLCEDVDYDGTPNYIGGNLFLNENDTTNWENRVGEFTISGSWNNKDGSYSKLYFWVEEGGTRYTNHISFVVPYANSDYSETLTFFYDLEDKTTVHAS